MSMANRDISRHVVALSEFGLRFLNGGGDLLTARLRVRIPVPEPNLNSICGLPCGAASLGAATVQQRCRNRRRIGASYRLAKRYEGASASATQAY